MQADAIYVRVLVLNHGLAFLVVSGASGSAQSEQHHDEAAYHQSPRPAFCVSSHAFHLFRAL
jgi:hypothetical protein